MAAPVTDAGEFESWLNDRLDSLEVDREVYGAYILGVLQEEESDEEKEDALQGILSAFLVTQMRDHTTRHVLVLNKSSGLSSDNTSGCWSICCVLKVSSEVQAIASLIEKQAQIVVKHKKVSEETKKGKEALLAQYANVTDDEHEDEEEEATSGNNFPAPEKSLFKNTNVEEVLNRQKQKRDQARDDAQKKKEGDKMQREKDKLSKQDRKEKEKKRTQKGERKR
uniref:Coiled-coil domain-containing protein 43 n=1 Tax=Gasterosteus aculeatus aculeatus TaxID=481459 RepID=A0AAQ4R8B2_GASAC